MAPPTQAELDDLWIRCNAGHDPDKCVAFEEYVGLWSDLEQRLKEGAEPDSVEVTTLKLQIAATHQLLIGDTPGGTA